MKRLNEVMDVSQFRREFKTNIQTGTGGYKSTEKVINKLVGNVQATVAPDLFCHMVWKELKLHVIKEYKFCETRKFMADYYIPSLKLLIEQEGGIYSGGAHGSIKGIIRDIEKYNLATVLGYKLLRFLPKEMNTMKPIEMIRELIKNQESS